MAEMQAALQALDTKIAGYARPEPTEAPE